MGIARTCWLALPLACGLLIASGCPHVVVHPATAAPEVIPPGVGAHYKWKLADSHYEPVAARFPCPAGFRRVVVPKGSWGYWLRYLPLRAPGTPVRTYTGRITAAGDDPSVGAVIDLDVRKYQQCADVVDRLRAEWLRSRGEEKAIAFRTADGPVLSWSAWAAGTRVHEVGDHLVLTKGAAPDRSRANFDRYLASVFQWCNTESMVRQSDAISALDLMPGDIFIRGGSPGHVVLVLDVAKDSMGRMKAIIAQGYMPAQSACIVAENGWPWLDMDPAKPVYVPRYGRFEWSALRRLRAPETSHNPH